MERHCTTVSFALRKSKTNNKGLAPIEVTIYSNSDRVSFNTGKFVFPSQWNKDVQIVKGRTEEAALVNDYLCELRNKVFQKERELMERGYTITATLLRDAVLDKIEALTEKTLLSFLQEYIESRRPMVGKNLSEASFYVYERTHKLLGDFIGSRYHRKDMALREVNLLFMQGFHGFLLKIMNQNTASKHLGFTKSLMGYAVANGYIQYNLIQSFKVERVHVDVAYLDGLELSRFEAYSSPLQHLMVAKDMFLFGCYTGLSYSDITSLGIEHLYFDDQHRLWIRKKRVKTGVLSRIPVLPQAKAIIIKYAVMNLSSFDFHFVPIQDLADLNKNIKKIAKQCNISKHITFHTSRHTFATTVTLSHHISLEVVSKMMGHTNTRMTSHYARVVDQCIADEMDALTKRYEQQIQTNSLIPGK